MCRPSRLVSDKTSVMVTVVSPDRRKGERCGRVMTTEEVYRGPVGKIFGLI